MRAKRKLRIGIDLTGLWRPMTGTFVYGTELTRHLLSLDDRNEYTLFFSDEVHPSFREFRARFRPIVIPIRGEVISKQLALAILCNSLALDLIHFPAFPPPLVCFRRFIWTIHDAAAWLYPGSLDWKGFLYFRGLGTLTANCSKALITVSDESKRNIIDVLGTPERKVRVIYPGIDSSFFRRIYNEAVLSLVRERYRLPERFLLTVGTLEPKKNVPSLIQAYRRFCKTTQINTGLVIVGRKGWKTQEIDRCLSESGQGVILTGFVAREDLVALYSLAEVFVLLSICEGFGFPPLEAMACGCPVIVSDRGALPEIVGNAALVVEPDNPDLVCQAMRSILNNPAQRVALAEKGLARVKEFSWRTTANKTLDLYREVAESR